MPNQAITWEKLSDTTFVQFNNQNGNRYKILATFKDEHIVVELDKDRNPTNHYYLVSSIRVNNETMRISWGGSEYYTSFEACAKDFILNNIVELISMVQNNSSDVQYEQFTKLFSKAIFNIIKEDMNVSDVVQFVDEKGTEEIDSFVDSFEEEGESFCVNPDYEE